MILLISEVSNALTHQYNGDKLHFDVSNKEHNRIKFGKLGITEVIGDPGNYLVVQDKASGNIFILPKLDIGKKFAISLVNPLGHVQDVECFVKDIPGQFLDVIIQSTIDKESVIIADMLSNMIKGEKGKYYVEKWNRKIDHDPCFELLQEHSYKFGNLMGVILRVKNISGNSLTLKEKDFERIFERTKAITISDRILDNREVTYVYIITEFEGGNDR